MTCRTPILVYGELNNVVDPYTTFICKCPFIHRNENLNTLIIQFHKSSSVSFYDERSFENEGDDRL